ncbi:transmembrane protein 243 isoform X2 [Physeter macrocephalus]|uniref:Transmembrane protein 243 isoform X2 n=1 Tax=Physeter macrocephalus TaxID=9755 RepID=A0A2Y9FAD7_PHYMC|nr:transmembrane protein 243 isoform X2 [Physeter catodon]XP_028345926.1 transmembrane protein 243 isoform X2 [Physeter catodon]|eukprot:XP_007118211.1 transmembrane protein 243 isoform X2 [Physeter catodon]
MENFSTRTYGTSGLDNRPLFGETSAKDRIINLVVGSLTSLLILVTLISAFVFPQLPPKPLNIFFAVCISLSSITACILVDSKFIMEEQRAKNSQDTQEETCPVRYWDF